MDRLFVVDENALREYGADGVLIRYICEHYISRVFDRVIYTSNNLMEKSELHSGREYRVIPMTDKSIQNFPNNYKCCQNCRNLIEIPKNNRYSDVEHFCIMTGYFTSGTDRDISKIKRYTPGGKELNCQWAGKNN